MGGAAAELHLHTERAAGGAPSIAPCAGTAVDCAPSISVAGGRRSAGFVPEARHDAASRPCRPADSAKTALVTAALSYSSVTSPGDVIADVGKASHVAGGSDTDTPQWTIYFSRVAD